MNPPKNKVLCLIRTNWTDLDIDDQNIWMDIEPISRYSRKIEEVIPLYDHPHSDRENGQKEIHYHVDSRYLNSISYNIRVTLPLKENERLEYRELKQIHSKELSSTSRELIRKSKLKNKCIHKGKCPHRGYDLTNEKPVHGVITCPLHSLKFDAITKQLIN